MTYIVTSDYTLNRVAPPNLPLAPQAYDSRYQEQLNNVLRLYFNQLNNILGQLNAVSPTTVANLPSAAVAGVGSRLFVTDSSVSTFGTTVTGGGSTKVPVYSDGTNWKVG
jgi:hypothetical protein